MAAPKAAIQFTYEDYKSLPESETRRYELLDGELVMVPSPTEPHQRIAGNLEFLLRQFVRQHGRGGRIYDAPLDVVLGQGEGREVVQPDLLWISQERMGIIAEEEIQGAPDLVVEIISPTTEKRDRGYKKTLYARHGVQEFWIVSPEAKTVEVFTSGETGFKQVHVFRSTERLTSPLLEGLVIDLQELFSS